MAIVPASSHGTSFNGGTITTPLTVKTGVDEVALELTAPAGMSEYVAHAATVAGSAEVFASVDNTSAALGANGGSGTGGATLSAEATGGAATVSGPAWTVGIAGATSSDHLSVGTGAGVAPFTVDPNGYLLIGTHAAPADAALDAGECALWFDQTNGVGATKLMVKGKSADGTVKTATIVLA